MSASFTMVDSGLNGPATRLDSSMIPTMLSEVGPDSSWFAMSSVTRSCLRDAMSASVAGNQCL